MIVVKTHRATETIRGMELVVVIKYPEAATMGPLIEQVAELFTYARKDPDQLGLFDKEDKTDPK